MLVTQLYAVTESQVRIPAPRKYCKAAAAAVTVAAATTAEAAAPAAAAADSRPIIKVNNRKPSKLTQTKIMYFTIIDNKKIIPTMCVTPNKNS